jgi:HD-GYP domain-containing protein (c-di-GMP phosphodiesterase class II)
MPENNFARSATAPSTNSVSSVRMSEVLGALSQALDITEGQPAGHSARSCAIGMRLAQETGLPADQQSSLFYALLMKDAGCSSNSAKVCALFGHNDIVIKRDGKTVDTDSLKAMVGYISRNLSPDGSYLTRAKMFKQFVGNGANIGRLLTKTRCERGAEIARKLDFTEDTATAIHSLDEHWDGGGHPDGLKGVEIPLLGRYLGLAQCVDFYRNAAGIDGMYEVIEDRSGRWFDPDLVMALQAIRHDTRFWESLTSKRPESLVRSYEPEDRVKIATDARIDRVAEAFAQVIDAKSPYTATHSAGVAEIAVGIGKVQGLIPKEINDLNRAGLLHDIGKLGVPNTILDKPNKLSPAEWKVMKEHPRYTEEILSQVSVFKPIAQMAGRHHERLDGTGYHRGIRGEQMTQMDKILQVADVAEALAADRPYRAGMSVEQVFSIVDSEAGTKLDPGSVEALHVYLDGIQPISRASLAA